MPMLDFERINQTALVRLPDLLPELLPEGRLHGREYRCGDLAGNPGQSLSINVYTCAWSDFATGDKGGDPVSLVAAVRGVSQTEAAQWLGGINTTQQHRPASKRPLATWESAPTDTPPQAINHPEHGRPTTTWEYRGSKGELLGYACRFDHAGKKKAVIPYTHGMDNKTGETGWRWKSFTEPRPLYGIDRLKQRPNAPALVVEGEKTADAAQRLIPGVVVITWPGGSGAAAKADFEPLKGRRVAIWPDHDEPGRKAGEIVARTALKAGAAEVSIIEPPPDKADGWDLADAEAEGWTAEHVTEWIKGHRRKVVTDEQEEAAPDTVETARHGGGLVAVTIGAFLAREFPPRSNLLSPWLPSQGLAMVFAYRGVGKTHFALGVAYAVASGGSFLGWQAPEPVGVLYIDGEMPGPVMQERLSEIVRSNDKQATAPFILLTPDLQPEGMPRIDSDEGQAAIESILTDDIKLIVVDNISTLSGAKENDGDGWGPIQGWALKQRAAGRSVLFVHHSGKGGAQRGTSRREDVLDTSIALRRPVDYQLDQGAVFEIHFEKARGIHGEDVKPLEATLTTDDHGIMAWHTRTVEDSTFDRVVGLLNEGMSQNEVANELNINKSSVSRHAKKAKAAGLVESKKEPVKRKGAVVKRDIGGGLVELTKGAP